MQAETSALNPWVPVVLTIIGIVVAVGVPVVGWAFRSVHKRIDEVKADAESKRLETRDTLLELVEAKFDAIWNTLKDIKNEVKGHH